MIKGITFAIRAKSPPLAGSWRYSFYPHSTDGLAAAARAEAAGMAGSASESAVS